jgi:CubicO group peptidase (beta-lactamase class C family)
MLVSRRGKVIIDFVEGYADKAARRPLKRDSVFIAMSLAKQITNVLALSLVEKGLLRLHTPVADVIPEFAQFGKQRVNLYHLMTHTSGVLRGVPEVGPDTMLNIEKLTAYACDRPLDCLPGERVNYSLAVAHSIIAAMCLRVDGRGRNFATMLDEDLFIPLGMKETSFGPREDLAPRVCPLKLAQEVPFNGLAAALVEGFTALLLTPGCESPAAGMLTTIDDIHRFTEMLRCGGELDGARILSPAMLNYCTRNFTGAMRNMVWDPTLAARHWQSFPANIGLGFYIRGEDVRPGPFGMLNSPNTFGGFGAGSNGLWVDPMHQLSFSFLSTGLLEDSYHLERTALLSDLVMSALVN